MPPEGGFGLYKADLGHVGRRQSIVIMEYSVTVVPSRLVVSFETGVMVHLKEFSSS
jgi:hypothetical protein